jgi:hypothetical protein
MSSRLRMPMRTAVLLGLTALIAGLAGPTGAASAGFKTDQAPMLNPVIPRAWVDPIITVGDEIGDYQFESIPDGISIRKSKGDVEIYVNHETSTVPFPYFNDPNAVPPTSPTQANSQNDFNNAELSRLVLNPKDASIANASMVIGSDQGFQRFCSNFLATKEHGFERDLLLTNEEAVDWVNKNGPSFWPATEGASTARQSGAAVAYDPASGEARPIWGMGRLNHENSLAMPGYKKPVVITGDDTFVNSPAQSQMYMYIANDANSVWNDTGDLYAFVSDGTQQQYSDFSPLVPAGSASTTGHFIKIPKFIATGKDPATGDDLMSARAEQLLGVAAGTYTPPTDGSFSRPPGKTTGASVDGPQWVLERWSQLNGAFRFIRLEDMAYDKRPGMSNVVYVIDSGRGTAGTPAAGVSTNGRVWKMVLDPNDPTKVTSLSILIEGDDSAVKTPSEIHQPDNIESTQKGLYITEDPGSSQQFNYSEAQLADGRRTEARIWQYRFDGTMRVAFKIDQSADEGPTDVDPVPNPIPSGGSARGNLGAWEASGIVDVSDQFGPGTFLVTVQAHTLFVETKPGLDVTGDSNPDILDKREGGQLLLIHVPNG